MQTSVAVFLAFVVIYFGAFMLPAEYSQKTVGWAAQAATLTGAVATFMVLYSHRIGLPKSLMVLFGTSVMSALSAMATVACVQTQKCSPTFPVHVLVLSSAVLSGTAAFTGFLLGNALGLPLWAAIVASIAFAPVFVAVVLPAVSQGVKSVVDKFA